MASYQPILESQITNIRGLYHYLTSLTTRIVKAPQTEEQTHTHAVVKRVLNKAGAWVGDTVIINSEGKDYPITLQQTPTGHVAWDWTQDITLVTTSHTLSETYTMMMLAITALKAELNEDPTEILIAGDRVREWVKSKEAQGFTESVT